MMCGGFMSCCSSTNLRHQRRGGQCEQYQGLLQRPVAPVRESSPTKNVGCTHCGLKSARPRMSVNARERLLLIESDAEMCLPDKLDSAEERDPNGTHGSPTSVRLCPIPDLVPLTDSVHLRCDMQKETFAQIGAQLRDISDAFERHRKDQQNKTVSTPRLLADTVSLVQILRSVARTAVIPYLHLLNGLYWVYA